MVTRRPSRESLEALESIGEALNDAHDYWHDAADSYHDPSTFRRHAGALIQASRNTTFRMQNYKASIDSFDDWYEPWQRYLKSNELMKWMHDARTEVTKRRGISQASRGHATTVTSYLEPLSIGIDFDPSTPSMEVVARLAAMIPDEYREHVMIEVERAWIPEGRENEFLADAGRAVRIIASMTDDLARFVHEGTHRLPGLIAGTGDTFSCTKDEGYRVMRVEADTGASHKVWVKDRKTLPLADPAATARRYGFTEQVPAPSDVFEFAEALIPQAIQVLRHDGHHIHLLILRGPDGIHDVRTHLPRDKRDKYVFWQDIAKEVKRAGYTELVTINEVWFGEVPKRMSLYHDVSKDPDRREALTITAARSDGEVRAWAVMFERDDAENVINLSEPSPLDGSEGFLLPVLTAWADGGEDS